VDASSSGNTPTASSQSLNGRSRPSRFIGWIVAALALVVLAFAAWHLLAGDGGAAAGPGAPEVGVAKPLRLNLDTRMSFLGQLSAVDSLDVRAQVGGTLTGIHFKDGDVIHKGDLLFSIDPRPYEIALSRAQSELETATAKRTLADSESHRAQALQQASAGSVQNVEQRASDRQSAQAAVDRAEAEIRDAQFDLDHCRIVAPFSGRIGAHLVSVGNLVAGSRAGTGSTTLLARLVSVDPIHLDFDMSEADYQTFAQYRSGEAAGIEDKVELSLGNEKEFGRKGVLDFVDNELNRSSGTIHARATVPNADFSLTPGAFARVRAVAAKARSTLLVPDSSVLPDQAKHLVMTVSTDGTVVAKPVETGDLRGGLRVIRSGLSPDDKVVIDGISFASPGAKVVPKAGKISFDESQE
jgi:RND family efflux transporter MFP subunit